MLRARDATRLGATLPDALFTTVSCTRCHRFVELPEAAGVAGASYRDLDGLERLARARHGARRPAARDAAGPFWLALAIVDQVAFPIRVTHLGRNATIPPRFWPEPRDLLR